MVGTIRRSAESDRLIFKMDLIEIGKLVLFAKANYPAFKDLPDRTIAAYFTTYQDTIIIDRQGDKIRGFAIYQEWPDFCNFIIICHLDDNNVRWLLRIVRNELAGRQAAWFDEKRMSPRFIKCHQ